MSNKFLTFFTDKNGERYALKDKNADRRLSALESRPAITTLDGFDFINNDINALSGEYFITNAINSPFEDTDGVLTIMHNGEETIEIWESENTIAHRKIKSVDPLEEKYSNVIINGSVIDTTINADDFNENGIKVRASENTIYLEPNGDYEISGLLVNTKLEIDVPGTETETTIHLNGLYIYRDDFVDTEDEDNAKSNVEAGEPCIYIGGTKGDDYVIIELVENSKNYMIRDDDSYNDSYNSKAGVIYSDKANIILTGTGALGIDSWLGGHGIKSKLGLTINGNPILKVRAYHDILHGNSYLDISGGYFQAVECNDFLGTDTSVGDVLPEGGEVGTITIDGGFFDCVNMSGTFLQADSASVDSSVVIRYKDVGEGLLLQANDGITLGFDEKTGDVCSLVYNNSSQTDIDFGFVVNSADNSTVIPANTCFFKLFATPFPFSEVPADITDLLDDTNYPHAVTKKGVHKI